MDWLFTFADPDIDWNYAMLTLIVRFIGVFVVMGVMQVALQVSSRIVQRIEAPAASAPGPATAVDAAPVVDGGATASAPAAVVDEGVDEVTAAAIGLALALESRSPAGTADAATSSWAAAGRIQQLQRNPR